MPFPETPRIIFNKSPLQRVLCQLKFPPILKIEAEIPAEFQEKVRKDFPNFSEGTTPLKLELPSELKNRIPTDLLALVSQGTGGKNYEFTSEDGETALNLTRTFLGLTTNQYTRWEEFREKLGTPLDALTSIYAPSYFTRIGLRYIDVIKRSDLGLGNVEWDTLLQPFMLGVLSASPEIRNHVLSHESRHEIRLSDETCFVRVVTRLVEDGKDGETCLQIDSDFYTSTRINVENALEKLDYFNLRISRLLQWCIKDPLLKAMEPVPK